MSSNNIKEVIRARPPLPNGSNQASWAIDDKNISRNSDDFPQTGAYSFDDIFDVDNPAVPPKIPTKNYAIECTQLKEMLKPVEEDMEYLRSRIQDLEENVIKKTVNSVPKRRHTIGPSLCTIPEAKEFETVPLNPLVDISNVLFESKDKSPNRTICNEDESCPCTPYTNLRCRADTLMQSHEDLIEYTRYEKTSKLTTEEELKGKIEELMKQYKVLETFKESATAKLKDLAEKNETDILNITNDYEYIIDSLKSKFKQRENELHELCNKHTTTIKQQEERIQKILKEKVYNTMLKVGSIETRELTTKTRDLESRILTLEEEKICALESLKDAERNIKNLNEIIADLNSNFQSKMSEHTDRKIEQLEKLVKVLKDEIRDYESKLKNLTFENTYLSEKLRQLEHKDRLHQQSVMDKENKVLKTIEQNGEEDMNRKKSPRKSLSESEAGNMNKKWKELRNRDHDITRSLDLNTLSEATMESCDKCQSLELQTQKLNSEVSKHNRRHDSGVFQVVREKYKKLKKLCRLRGDEVSRFQEQLAEKN